MTRMLKDWLPAYLDYTSGTEAPRLMHFFCGVSTLAGVLQRKVWIDMKRFKWNPSFYIIFVADPGIVSKTTTMDLGMDLLKQVPGVKFGPDVVTWQRLVEKFVEAESQFIYNEMMNPQSPLTLASGELGNLIDTSDQDMINFLITMWDGKASFEKSTKTSGENTISAPWINMIGCTTPSWMATNVSDVMAQGGFTSRCIFVFAERKETYVAYPDEAVRPDHEAKRAALINDLEHILVNMVGPFELPEETRAWGRAWYERIWSEGLQSLNEDSLKGYLARKQTHLHKLAMVLSASRSDERVITLEDMVLADTMLAEAEKHMHRVFEKLGATQEAIQGEKLLRFVKHYGKVPYAKALQHVRTAFPDFRDFEGILNGYIRSGLIELRFEGMPRMVNGQMQADAFLVYKGPD